MKPSKYDRQEPLSQKIVQSTLVILSMEKTMGTKVISELNAVSRLKIFAEKLSPVLEAKLVLIKPGVAVYHLFVSFG